MNELHIIGKQNVAGIEFTGIEGGFGEDKKAMLVKEIAEIHGQELKEINRRINDNRKRFIDGLDIIDLLSGSNPLREFAKENGWIGSNRTINVYILSERGYAKLLKILEDDKAWELYDAFVDGYFNMRKVSIDTSQLSPELQMFNKIFTSLAARELENKRIEQEIADTRSEIKGIRDIVALNTREWKKDVNKILNAIAFKLGGYEQYKNIRNESYELLEQRAKADLTRRLSNRKKNLALEGVSKSKINNTTKMDVIDADKRLLEIYLAVVKEMAIKYQVDIPANVMSEAKQEEDAM